MKLIMKLLILTGMLAMSLSAAAGGSNPGLFYGQVPTAAQWNSYFAAKLDYTPGAASTIPYWDGSGNLLNAAVSGSCTSMNNVFTCGGSTATNFSANNLTVNGIVSAVAGSLPIHSSVAVTTAAPNTGLSVTDGTASGILFASTQGGHSIAMGSTSAHDLYLYAGNNPQVQVLGTAGTTNLVTLSGSVGGSPTIGTSGGTLATAGALSLGAVASASTHAVRADQVSTDSVNFPLYTPPTAWTPNQGPGLTVVGTFSSTGSYTKIGKLVTVEGHIASTTTIAVAAVGVICTNLPFASKNATLAGFGTLMNSSATASSVIFNSGANSTNVTAETAIGPNTDYYFSLTYIAE